MTKIVITADKCTNNIRSVSCVGHSGYGQEGEDIVCAALSSVVQTALLGLLTVVGINVNINRDDELGVLKFNLPDNLSDSQMHDAQVVLSTMLAGVNDLSETWSRYIKLEVKQNVY